MPALFHGLFLTGGLQVMSMFLFTAGNMNSSCDNLSKEMEKEYDWLRHVENLCEDEISSESDMSWAAYHASLLP